VLPAGEPVPTDGRLPRAALRAVGAGGFGVYVHVPFCASRCGYCDFNTYTAAEGVLSDGYVDTLLAEFALAGKVLAEARPPRVSTVFVGGGTPTLLGSGELARILEGVDATWGLTADVEVSTEANPETVEPAMLTALRRAGYTRISLGMQSVAPHVLAVLDRRHTPGRAALAAAQARDAGFDHVNLDLIYGTPGESADDFAASLDAVLAAGVDHVSAYALIVEEGTRLAARIGRGELAHPDDDVAADRYLAAEAALTAAGFGWYEVSNWARTGAADHAVGRPGDFVAGARCRHNLLYWTGGDWWGFGPGAHSHVGGVRWWNVKHPAAYAARLAQRHSPAQARELLSPAERHTEEVMLGLRLADGVALTTLDDAGRAAAGGVLADGLLDPGPYAAGRAVLTLRGRLLADAVVRDLLGP